MSDLQQLGLLLSELLQLLQWLQEQFGSGEDLQALLRSLREAKFTSGSLHLLQGPSHRLHIGQDHLRVGKNRKTGQGFGSISDSDRLTSWRSKRAER